MLAYEKLNLTLLAMAVISKRLSKASQNGISQAFEGNFFPGRSTAQLGLVKTGHLSSEFLRIATLRGLQNIVLSAASLAASLISWLRFQMKIGTLCTF